MQNKKMVLGALLMALTVIMQSLRLVLPFPPVVSTFIIGTSVNMMLIITGRISGFKAAALLTILLPVLAYMQGQLLLPLLIPVVIAGNLLYVALLRQKKAFLFNYLLPPTAKALLMYLGAYLVLSFLQLENSVLVKNILFAMSVPQFVTGLAGILAAEKILEKLKKIH